MKPRHKTFLLVDGIINLILDILLLWLIFEPLNLPLRGRIVLWVVAIGVFDLFHTGGSGKNLAL